VSRGRVVALLVLGCALAAAAAGTGPYLIADTDAPPFRLAVRRAVVQRPRAKPKGAGAVLQRYAAWIGVVVEVVVGLVALAFLLLALWRIAQVLARLARLRLARSVGRATAEAYDDTVLTDDAEAVLRRRVREELVALSADLDTMADPRETVIACYVRMERALAGAGSPRRDAESPLELVARVLGEQRVPEPDVRRLTELFTEARFSEHPVTDEMRDAARRSLGAVADALAVPA
jgi:hypothetical protein